MAKKNSIYFEDFKTMTGFSWQAAKHLQASLEKFNPKAVPEILKSMHEIEHAEDGVRHNMMRRLAKEFVTPIDREDIIHLANDLDTLTDKIEDIVIHIHMYNIQEIRPEALDMAEIIVKCSGALQRAMEEFPNFQKSTTLRTDLIAINTLEEKGDDIYIDAVHKLFREEQHSIRLIAWSKLFDLLEDCCDACENIAEAMEVVIMKNS